MTRPKNVSDFEWRLRCNLRYSQRKEEVAKLNRSYRVNNPIRYMYGEAKKRAKKTGVPFTIEMSDIKIPVFCPLLGILLTPPGQKKFTASSPSLDRIRNDLGYVKGNVRVISDLANRMKRDATPEQLRVFALSILVEQGFLELEY